MGWKTFKEHFNIEHIVRIEEGKLCIGSPYIYNLISIDISTGKVVAPTSDHKRRFLAEYYPAVKEASSELILDLLTQEDVFEQSIKVYTFDYMTYDILEKYCETFGYPNVTHDGCRMDDRYFTNRDDAIKRAKESLASEIEWRSQRVQELEAEFLQAKAKLEYLKGLEIT